MDGSDFWNGAALYQRESESLQNKHVSPVTGPEILIFAVSGHLSLFLWTL